MTASMTTASTTVMQQSLHSELEPYATTDILRAEKDKLQQQHHYAVIIWEKIREHGFPPLYFVRLITLLCVQIRSLFYINGINPCQVFRGARA